MIKLNKNKILYFTVILIILIITLFSRFLISKGKSNILLSNNIRLLSNINNKNVNNILINNDDNLEEYHEASENNNNSNSKVWNDSIDKHNNKKTEEEEKKHEEINEALIIYFMIVCLIIGALSKEIKKITNIPFTPLLMVSGILLGVYSGNLGLLGKGIELVMQINPHGILFIFIPVLIFESAFNSDPFVFKREIFQVITLAGPGVVIGSILLSFFFKVILNYGDEFSWSACLTFSSIVCATDPVAVVALLKELGASTRFSILLEGESLLNDGTAMVFYLTFSSIYKNQADGFLSIILNFLQFSVGGPIFGIIICFTIILWIRRIIKDDMLTMNLTFIACYFTFFIGEFYLEVSGILAIVTLGIMMGNLGKVEINPESEQAIHHVWSFLQFLFEIIIFIITGCFLGKTLFSIQDSTIVFADFIKCLIFFVLMTFGRYLMIMILKPIINKVGYPIDNKDVLVLTYGGLRGAIALCLALIVTVDEEYPKRFREIVLFYVNMIILLTVLINGLTIKILMKKINFQPVSSTKKKIHITLKKTLIISALEKQQSLIHNNFLKLVNWEEVYDISGLNNQIKQIDNLEADESIQEINRQSHLINREKIQEVRMRFYKLVKSKIFEIFEQCLCDSVIIKELNEVLNVCLEELNKEIWIWECISNKFLSLDNLQYLVSKSNYLIVGSFVKSYLLNNILFSYAIISTIIKAMKEVLELHSKIPLPEEYVRIAFKEIKLNIKNSENYIFALTDLFPELVSKIQTVQATKILLNSQKHLIDEYLKDGYINSDEHLKIRDSINKQIKNTTLEIGKWEIKKFDQFTFIKHCFGDISISNLQILKDNSKIMEYKEGEYLLKKDGIYGGIFIIISGIVHEEYKQGEVQNNFGMGSIFCLGNIVLNSEQSICNVKAVSNVKTYLISSNIIKDLIFSDKEFKISIYKQAFFSLIKYLNLENILQIIPNLHYMIEKSKFIQLKKRDFITFDYGGFLFEGKMKNEKLKNIYESYSLIHWEKSNDLVALEDSYILKFDEVILSNEDDKRNSLNYLNQRNSIINIINKEKDTDNLFKILKSKIQQRYQK